MNEVNREDMRFDLLSTPCSPPFMGDGKKTGGHPRSPRQKVFWTSLILLFIPIAFDQVFIEHQAAAGGKDDVIIKA